MDSYQETIRYLYNLQYSGIKLGLDNVARLLRYLGDPQKKWPAIHIAGTNGKGSTAAFLYTTLREAGHRVGLYTSPHLVDFTERIRINDTVISWEKIVEYTRQIRPRVEKEKATFFEATTALAFHYFAEEKLDIAVIETGMGGRLDATNLVQPLATVITAISTDHQQYLGDTISQIAREKAGIIKTEIPCFTHITDPEIRHILQETCTERRAPFRVIDPTRDITVTEETIHGSHFDLRDDAAVYRRLKISLAGWHQVKNAALSALTLRHLPGFAITDAVLRRGLAKTAWPGRLQIFRERPLTILDVAHNPDGFEKVFQTLQRTLPHRPIWAIAGISKDKDLSGISDILSQHARRVGIVGHFSDRALDPAVLADRLHGREIPVDIFPDVVEAFKNYQAQVSADDLILIIGSHFLVGDFLKKIQLS